MAVAAAVVEDVADAPTALPEVATLTATHLQDVVAEVDVEVVVVGVEAVVAVALRSVEDCFQVSNEH